MMNSETGVMGQKGGTSEMGQTRPEEKSGGVGSLFSQHGSPLPARVTHPLHRCAVGDSLALYPGEE
jgi:hypothetical protein